MVSAPKHISNKKKSTKQLSHFSRFWSLIVILCPQQKLLTLKHNEIRAAIEIIYF